MREYLATLKAIYDADSFLFDINIGGGQFIIQRVRLLGVQAPDIRKTKHTSFKGSLGVQIKYVVKQWFFERDPQLIVRVYGKGICGRWLCEVFTWGALGSLNDYLRGRYFGSAYWGFDNQEIVIKGWFSGEVVEVPQGGTLPIFHIWGKMTNKAGRSNQTGRL